MVALEEMAVALRNVTELGNVELGNVELGTIELGNVEFGKVVEVDTEELRG
jgi:hypothetical protein